MAGEFEVAHGAAFVCDAQDLCAELEAVGWEDGLLEDVADLRRGGAAVAGRTGA